MCPKETPSLKHDLIVPTSLVAGFGVSKWYTNIREFSRDEAEVNALIPDMLAGCPTYDPMLAWEEHNWLQWFLSPHCGMEGERKAATIARVHLEGRGKPASFAFEAFFTRTSSDPNYWLVVKDAEAFLAKKALKGLVSVKEGKRFMDPPSVKTIVVEPDHYLREHFEDLLTYMQESGEAHRQRVAENVAKRLGCTISGRWKGKRA